MLHHIHHLIGIKIQPHHRIVGFRLCRFLFDTQHIPFLVELCHAIPFRIIHPITENRRLLFFLSCPHRLQQHPCKTLTIKYIIAQYQTSRIFPYKFLPDDKRLRQPIRTRLFCILETHPVIRPVPQ